MAHTSGTKALVGPAGGLGGGRRKVPTCRAGKPDPRGLVEGARFLPTAPRLIIEQTISLLSYRNILLHVSLEQDLEFLLLNICFNLLFL